MLVDLTVKLSADTPVYPGDEPAKITPAATVVKEGWTDHIMSLPTHLGTHIDAPAHMIAGGHTLGKYDITQFIGNGVLIDAREGYDLLAISNMEIYPGDVVLVYTGKSSEYGEATYFAEPHDMPEGVAKLMVDRKVSLMGIDAPSPDAEPFNVHKILLGGDVLIAENLSDMGELINRRFRVIALPLRLDLDGSPARVIAEII